jgi:hypothetical protein
MPLDDFRNLVPRNDDLRFRAYDKTGDDFYCWYRNRGEVAVEGYMFGELEESDEFFAHSLLRRFELQASTPSFKVIVVIDFVGLTRDYDWLSFMEGRVGIRGTLPEVVGIPAEWQPRVLGDLAKFETQQLPGHVLLVRQRAPDSLMSPPVGFAIM